MLLASASFFRAALGRSALAALTDVATGGRVAFDAVTLGRTEATLGTVRFSYGGVPVFSARRVRVRYRLRDLLPGGERRFGLQAVAIDGPEIVIERRVDGSLVLPGSRTASATGPASSSQNPGVPLRFELRVRGGRIVFLDPGRTLPGSRRFTIGGFSATATVDDAGRTQYAARGALDDDPGQSLSLAGTIDLARGYAQHRLRSPAISLAAFVNYYINTPSAAFGRCLVRGLDVRAYAFRGPAAAALGPYHLAGSGFLVDGAMKVPGLARRVTGMRGRIDLFDGGFAAPRLRARLGAADVALAGGLFDWGAPVFRIGLRARTDLGGVRSFFRFSRNLPVRGDARLATLLEGPVGTPIAATRVDVPELAYGNFPVTRARGGIVYYAQAVDVVGMHGRYGGLDIDADGAIDLGAVTHTQLVVAVAGGTHSIPYLAQAAPAVRLQADALLTGDALRFDARGTAAGSGGGTSLSGLFAIDPAGDGALGPLALVRDDGASLAGTFYLHRSASESGIWLAARDYPFAAFATAPKLPGVALVAPAFAGRLSGSLVGIGPPSRFLVAARVAARDLRVGSFSVAAASGGVAGTLAGVRLADVAARGAWGAFSGSGGYSGQRLALQGRYAGDFSKLATLTGDLGARGPVAGPVAILIDPQRTLVQVRGSESAAGSVRGLALDHLRGTVGIENGAVHVYGATATLAGGTAAAAGALGDADTFALSLADVDGAGAFGAGAGLTAGRLSAVGTVVVRQHRARFDGGVAIGGARFDGVPIAGNGDVAFDALALRVSSGDALAGPAVGRLAGTLAAPGTSRAAYDFAAVVPATELAPVARVFAPQIPYPAGTLAASVRARGRWPRVSLQGTIEAPEGSVNGLAFRDFAARIETGSGALDARDGRILVGSSRVSFAGSSRGSDASLRLEAPHADLGDFNDFFDAGDTLGGVGRVRGRIVARRGSLATSADVAIAGLRYRRFDLGDATAHWTSRGARVRGRIAFGGTSGSLLAAGTLQLAPVPLAELARRSHFDGTADVARLDLGVWLPALGYQLPLAGRVDARATISGPLGDPRVETVATLAGGAIGPFSVDRLSLRATSTLRRTTIEQAELQLPAVDASLSGSFGLGARDPIALGVHVKSSNLGLVAARLALGGLASSGRAEADVKVGGTRAQPAVSGAFNVEQAVVHGVAVPEARGEFSLHGRNLVLSGAEVRLATGTLALQGSVPLQILPLGFGPPQAPIALAAAATGVDLRAFTALLPAGSTLAGSVDGRVDIGGTVGRPRLGGGLTLAGGTLRTPLETIPLENLQGHLAFAGNTLRLENASARAGSGSFGASGSATVPDFVHPGDDATYAFHLRADHAILNLPAYGGGQVDGSLEFSRVAGAPPLLRGDITLSDATIPFSALAQVSGGAGPAPGGGWPAAGLDVALIAASNVRVRSANVDIGARGSVHAGGTSAAPVLAGGFTSTGGTLSYFNTVFRIVDGTVTFRPDLGLIPALDAAAVTHVIDPDPNTVRNSSGSADITLAVSGPLNALTIGLSSNPSYDRQQILGLLLNAPAFGATNLFGETAQNPTYYGSTNTASLSPALVTSRSIGGELSVAQEAFGVANAQFTRTLLAPFETSFAGALGLSNFNLNVDYTGNVGLSARKVLGKDVNAIYNTSFGYPYRQTFGFEVKPNEFEAAQVTVFETLGAYDLSSLAPTGYLSAFNSNVRAAQPLGGTTGFSFSIQRLFP